MNATPTPEEVEGTRPSSDDRHRTLGLQRAARARTERAEKAADAAIRDLFKRGATINFTAVARVAGVTPAFLHRHRELSTRIRDLSRAQKETTREQCVNATGESAVIVALRRKIAEQQSAHDAEARQLRERVRELEHQIAALYGRLG
ncbi:transposase [Dermacoccus sp. PAMC28757]|uniref:DUF6262 family protein n=1 Tax=Dermacoccus sp. PAMC28757 TaxID=2762331 RepID=UPI00164E0154|nr:DUF6262 family protein [Dermacoccus sp. PAMC28757]QNK51673.1 transposase [Dermacoccus sp. PAMC28757]